MEVARARADCVIGRGEPALAFVQMAHVLVSRAGAIWVGEVDVDFGTTTVQDILSADPSLSARTEIDLEVMCREEHSHKI